MTSARVIVHISLQARFGELLADHERGGPLKTALTKLMADPLGAGQIIRGLKEERTARIRKLWVGGRRKHRLIYYVGEKPTGSGIWPVVPLFLSEELRGSFDWSKVDPNSIGAEVLRDLEGKRYDQFAVYTQMP